MDTGHRAGTKQLSQLTHPREHLPVVTLHKRHVAATPLVLPNRLPVALQSMPPSTPSPFPHIREIRLSQEMSKLGSHPLHEGVSFEFSFRNISPSPQGFSALRRPSKALTLPRKQLPGQCWGMGACSSGSAAPRDQRCAPFSSR